MSGSDVHDDDVFSAYLDGELTPVERAAFEARVVADGAARAELDEVAEVRSLVRDLGSVAMPTGFVDELLATGAAEPFAPAGRRFRQWAAVPSQRERSWPGLLHEALEFAAGR